MLDLLYEGIFSKACAIRHLEIIKERIRQFQEPGPPFLYYIEDVVEDNGK
jgi:hypothetical protein